MPRKIGETRHNPYRVVDTWVYEVKDVEIERMQHIPKEDREEGDEKAIVTRERITNRKVTCELRMEKKTTQSNLPPHPTQEVKFELVCEELKFKLEGTDIEALRAAMWSKLDKKFEIEWHRYYLVQVKREHVYGGDGIGLEFSYNDVYKGITWDGKLLMRKWDYRDEKISVWPGSFKDEAGKVMACIPATDANREALKEFARRIDVLREKLADFLRPEKIDQTLANLATLALLPPAPPKKGKNAEEDDETVEA